MLGLLYPLYDRTNGWPALRTALSQALDGDGSTLLLHRRRVLRPQRRRPYSSNQDEAPYAVNCLDRADHSTVDEPAAPTRRGSSRRRRSSASTSPGATCRAPSGRCRRPTSRTEIHAKGAAPILVVGTTRDPATPYPWAQHLASMLASGRLLTCEGDGHTAYQRGSACVDAAVDAYLLHGTLPKAGTVCQT